MKNSMEAKNHKRAYTIYADIGNAPLAWVKDAKDETFNVGGNCADSSGWGADPEISTELDREFVEWAVHFDIQPWYRNDEMSKSLIG